MPRGSVRGIGYAVRRRVVTGSGLPLATGGMTGSSAAAVAAGVVEVTERSTVHHQEAIRAGQAPEWSPR
ncbi:hypothetical protein BH24ACT8_BH24ACT8_14870 [soil metagenome]